MRILQCRAIVNDELVKREISDEHQIVFEICTKRRIPRDIIIACFGWHGKQPSSAIEAFDVFTYTWRECLHGDRTQGRLSCLRCYWHGSSTMFLKYWKALLMTFQIRLNTTTISAVNCSSQSSSVRSCTSLESLPVWAAVVWAIPNLHRSKKFEGIEPHHMFRAEAIG